MIICKECGHRNPNGATFCENRACGAFLEWSGEVQPTEAVPVAPTQGPGWGASGPRHVGPSQVGVTVQVAEHQLAVDPGAGVETTVTVRNTGDVVDRYTFAVLGDTAPWATVDPPSVNLVPDAEGTARIVFSPPRTPEIVAGVRPFRLVVTSNEDRRASAFADGAVNVGPYADVTTALAPQIVEGRRGSYELAVTNRGNVPATVQVGALDAQQALAFRVEPPTVAVPPGATSAVRVHARPHNGQLSGPPRHYPFRVVAQTGADPPRNLDAQLVYRPLLPPIGKGWLVLLRVLLTLLGAALMILGAMSEWFLGIDGTDLTYETYVEQVFETDTPSPPESVGDTFVSVGLVPIVLAVFVLLGLASRTGLLTRLTAGFALIVMVVFAITVANAGISLGSGVFVVIAGTVLALLGGICGMAGKS